MDESSSGALIAFGIYTLAVFLLAILSNRVAKGKEFADEYFLGSRSFGVWAFALTFAATNASGGSFMGFPALIYTHGWTLALWIAGYMVVPLVSMALIGKRLNQVARKTGAITIPEVLRDRFSSPAVGLIASGLLVVSKAKIVEFVQGPRSPATSGIEISSPRANSVPGTAQNAASYRSR